MTDTQIRINHAMEKVNALHPMATTTEEQRVEFIQDIYTILSDYMSLANQIEGAMGYANASHFRAAQQKKGV